MGINFILQMSTRITRVRNVGRMLKIVQNDKSNERLILTTTKKKKKTRKHR